ncbi:MAG TPA: CinA family nicotinamide mononucleotide deamidase-related protein [Holophagaceae bacterium]|nr:CinA family nicotinamide mononucleotide deamidase-related protein [Holophagaceae bacterium]
MRIECIAIGTELLTTRRLDTNSVWLAERLADLGLAFQRKTAVGDDRADMARLFREALERSELIVCTGGLGPTFDDFTKELWAEVAGVPMHEDAQSRADLLAWYARRNRVPSDNNFKQVLFPEGSEPLPNPVGSAPGVWWEWRGRRIVLLPGVPREMKRMWEERVEPRLAGLAGQATHTLRMVVAGVPESALDERTRPLREKHGGMEWTILASLHQVELVARGADRAALDAAQADFSAELGPDLVRTGSGDLEDAVLDLLKARGETLAVAESMSGGMLASRLTSIPGASEAFLGGATVYTVKAKVALADADAAFTRRHGTVSEPVTESLAEGIRTKLGATWALAITGNAGPTEDPEGPAPVGTTIIALAGPEVLECRRYEFAGDREDIRQRACGWALDLLRRKLA